MKKYIFEKIKEFFKVKEVPQGNYRVSVQHMELIRSEAGDPVFSIQFKISEGKFKNRLLSCDQVILKTVQIFNCNEMLRTLSSVLSEAPTVAFTNYKEYAALLDAIGAASKDHQYELKYKPEARSEFFNGFEVMKGLV